MLYGLIGHKNVHFRGFIRNPMYHMCFLKPDISQPIKFCEKITSHDLEHSFSPLETSIFYPAISQQIYESKQENSNQIWKKWSY